MDVKVQILLRNLPTGAKSTSFGFVLGYSLRSINVCKYRLCENSILCHNFFDIILFRCHVRHNGGGDVRNAPACLLPDQPGVQHDPDQPARGLDSPPHLPLHVSVLALPIHLSVSHSDLHVKTRILKFSYLYYRLKFILKNVDKS